ncbi:MAG: hypothetical protein HS109_11720 [Burkholderiales bacterium]|nr:hypothetical protein [Burkholderiales bacterium]
MNRFDTRFAIPLAALAFLLAGPSFAQITASADPARSSSRSTAASFADIEQRAAQGDPLAAEAAGRALYEGRAPDGSHVLRDLTLSRYYLVQAAKAGSATALALVERIDASTAAGGSAYVPGPHGC